MEFLPIEKNTGATIDERHENEGGFFQYGGSPFGFFWPKAKKMCAEKSLWNFPQVEGKDGDTAQMRG